MPVSQRPRRKRGTPQHVRDLQGAAMPERAYAANYAEIEAEQARQKADIAGRRRPNAFQRRVGQPLANASRAVTSRGDSALSRMGVKTKTGALILGGTTVAVSRPRRKVEKRVKWQAQAAQRSASHARSTLLAGKGNFGKAAGIPEATNVRRVTTPRGPSGKFVSHENDLQVFHPQGRSNGRRTIDSGLAVYGKKKNLVGKAYTPTAPPAPNTRGRRLEGVTR